MCYSTNKITNTNLSLGPSFWQGLETHQALSNRRSFQAHPSLLALSWNDFSELPWVGSVMRQTKRARGDPQPVGTSPVFSPPSAGPCQAFRSLPGGEQISVSCWPVCKGVAQAGSQCHSWKIVEGDLHGEKPVCADSIPSRMKGFLQNLERQV